MSLNALRPDAEPADTCLIADIGGTNARFALSVRGRGGPDILHPQTRRVAEFDTVAAAARDYLQQLPVPRPARAVFAVASPVQGDSIEFTNSRWSFSTEALRRELGLDSLRIVNDFAAVAWALSGLRASDVRLLGGVPPASRGDGVQVVLGPGTGLGVAALRSAGGDAFVIESEGGHAGLAPRNEDELRVLQFLRARHGRVSTERLLSGDGLLSLYQSLCLGEDTPVRLHRAEDVSRAAREGHALARAATRAFCAALGGFAGDCALMFGAWNGVFLSGGMLQHLLDGDGINAFRSAFEDKGRFAGRLRAVPTWQILREDIGHLGAAMYDDYVVAHR